MTLDDLVDVFGPTDFVTSPNNKNLQVLRDPTMIYDKLRELSVTGNFSYSWEAIVAGVTNSGNAYFVGNLHVTLGGKTFTMPGVGEGEGDLGISGAATVALTNAFLRGYGAARWLYDRSTPKDAKIETTSVPTPAPQPSIPNQIPQPTPKPAPAARTWAKKATPAAPRPNPQGEWTGKELVDFGKHNGKMWETIPEDYLQYVTKGDKPNQDAMREINRRIQANPPSTTIPTDEDWEKDYLAQR